MTNLITTSFPDIPVSFDLDDMDNRYYNGINYKIYMETEDGKVELGDGGFVDWIWRMTNNKKERCLISGFGLERFLSL